MSPTLPLRADRIEGVFDGDRTPGRLAGLCLDLLGRQKRAWPACAEGYESLGRVMEREIACGGFSVRVQHNPGRATSTLADVAQAAVGERPCFLCPSNLPDGQKALLYRDEYLVLCNPMPVFSAHFTISHVAHEGQAIAGRLAALLRLSADFGPSFRLLYNGPECGASAPDHLHFQAVPSGLMPIEGEIRRGKGAPAKRLGPVSLWSVRDVGRQVAVLEGEDAAGLEEVFQALVGELRGVPKGKAEPMMNLICASDGRTYTILVFPRARHRPEAFYREDEGRLAVSPAAVEMGGIIVTPFEKDFARIDRACVAGLFREVSLDRTTFQRALDAIV